MTIIKIASAESSHGFFSTEHNLFREMLRLTLSLLVVKIVVSEWVEILPVSKNISEKSLYTTTQTYEVSMRNPLLSYQTDLNPHVSSKFEEKNGTQTNVVKKIQENVDQTKGKAKTQTKNEEEDDDDDDDEGSRENGSPIGMNSFMEFLKSAQKTLMQYKMNTYRSKMSVLKHLRDVLTLNINEKIANFKFADGNSEARTYKEEEHQMDYNSNEGALMTIGFLTFSVFLIKLVIKLVHLLKYKQQYYYNSMTTTTPATVVFLKRKGKMEDEHDITRILEYTEHLKN